MATMSGMMLPTFPDKLKLIAKWEWKQDDIQHKTTSIRHKLKQDHGSNWLKQQKSGAKTETDYSQWETTARGNRRLQLFCVDDNYYTSPGKWYKYKNS